MSQNLEASSKVSVEEPFGADLVSSSEAQYGYYH